MQRFARVCCGCGFLIGCIQGTKKSMCAYCGSWNNCWMDLMDYKDIPESHGICPECFMIRIVAVRTRVAKKRGVNNA